MALALALGRRGLGQCWPNPAVGAVVADVQGRIISCGWTAPGGRPHAEAIALGRAGSGARGATLYATLEPCSHWGKTPPCADAIVEAGIARVVYGITDPDERVAGRGLKRLGDHGIEVVAGPLQREARWLTLGHYLRHTHKRPFIQLKLALDRAGQLPVGGAGMPVWATTPDARNYGHMLRAEADAILIGQGTLLADDPDLTCRLPGMSWRSPVRIVLSTNGRLNPYAKMLKNLSTAPVWLIASPDMTQRRLDALEDIGTKVLRVQKNQQGRLHLHGVMQEMGKQGITRVLVEGGPSLQNNLLSEGLADEIIIFQGRKEITGPTLQPFSPSGLEAVTENPDYNLADKRYIGEDLIWIYRRTAYW
jgi:diaminohydroxyphosphoribosylaminopyrimidine deaminase/5-amino-6-(5-phosphoribosylamino)uracil reductase